MTLAEASSNWLSRRASFSWLRSWKSSARLYRESAAPSSSSASSGAGWPAAHESAAPA